MSAVLEHCCKLAASPLLFSPEPSDFERLIQRFDREVRELVNQLARGEISERVWLLKMNQIIRDGHFSAHQIGQLMAGIEVPSDVLAARSAAEIADAQSYFLQGFYTDLSHGKYVDDAGKFLDDAMYYRSRMYALATRGTAGIGFVDASPFTAIFDWVLGGAEEHCEDCPVLAEGSPYSRDTLYTTPGAGDTPCLCYCKCHLVRDDGKNSPLAIAI